VCVYLMCVRVRAGVLRRAGLCLLTRDL